ncbi:MAG: TIGR03546 family protein [Treponema sp.]|nr:TIGR03546 family protein [Treponema sp.]
MLSYIFNLLKALNSNSKPGQIANSFCIGLILGFMPKSNLLWFMLLVFFSFIRINKCGYGIMIILGSLTAWLLDPLFDQIGYAVLTFAPMENFYAWLLDVPFVGFTKFNNSILAGSLVFGLLAYIPLYFLMILFIKVWRNSFAPAFNESKFMKAFYKIPLVKKIVSLASENN